MSIRESVAAANEEWVHWGGNTIDLREGAKNKPFDVSTTDKDAARIQYILEKYCPAANSKTTAKDIRDDRYAWSGVTISYFMKKGGFQRWQEATGLGFPFSAGHRKWIKLAVRATKGGAAPRFMFHAFPIEHEQAMPKVGDLVAYARPDDLTKAEKSAGKKAREPSFEEAKSWFMRLDDDDDYLSHSDLVVHVAADDRFLEVIGGNVGQSVTKKLSLWTRGAG